MGLVTRLRDAVEQWRTTDPYHYECTVCDRAFNAERAACPDCGGDVERVAGEVEAAADVHY